MASLLNQISYRDYDDEYVDMSHEDIIEILKGCGEWQSYQDSRKPGYKWVTWFIVNTDQALMIRQYTMVSEPRTSFITMLRTFK